MTTELIRFGLLGTLFGFVWMMVVFSLMWAYAPKEQAHRKEMLVRYVLTVFLLLMLQIAALGITFLLHVSRQPTHLDATQQRHVVQLSN
jgi:formate hydrogenlyase subunit 3/multisubunit Na+/H+ antiporter MnhD subunit